MPDLIIKPTTTSGNKLILQDQAGGAVLTTADSGAEINNATNITASGNVTVAGDLVPATSLSHRNLIINGAFQVWQRSNSTSLETVANNNLKADRFKLNSDIQASDLTCARSTDVPAGQGFTNSMKVVPGGADTSIAAGQKHKIYNIFVMEHLMLKH